MTKLMLKTGLLTMLAVAVAGWPVGTSAADTNAPAVEKKEPKPKKSLVFHGKLKSVDKTAKTISVGERTFQITSETKISKADKPAMLEDGVVGEDVSGAYKKGDDGKLTATSVHFGPKSEKTKAVTEKAKAQYKRGFF